MRRVAALLAGCCVAASAAQLVPEQSEIAFTSRQMGVPVGGRFTKFDARVDLDPEHPERGHVALTIDTASASFGTHEVDSEATKPAWFDSARFPHATFVSSAIRGVAPARFEVAGRLTIKDSARDVVVPVTLAGRGALTVATGAFTIRRLDFNVGAGEWADTSAIADEVQVRFKLALGGLPAP
jgi:polyisoprenoid-binding protein YceI